MDLVRTWSILVCAFPTCEFGSIDCSNFLGPRRGRLNLSDRPQLIRRVARNPKVVIAFEDKLDVAYFELCGAAKLCKLTCGGHNVVHKLICYIEKGL